MTRHCRRSRYSDAVKRRAVRRYRRGDRARDIAEDIGCDISAVYQWLEAAGVERRRRDSRQPHSSSVRVLGRELYRCGHAARTVADIMHRTGYPVSPQSVLNWDKE